MAGYSGASVAGTSTYRRMALLFYVLRWSLTLPLIGLVILNIILPFMLFPMLLAPWFMIRTTMIAGFVPSLITVVVHIVLARRIRRWWMVPITVIMSVLTAWLWWGLAFEYEPARATALRDPNPLVLAIAALAALPFAIWARPSHRR